MAEDDSRRMTEWHETRPSPDPTRATTEQRLEAVAALKELVFVRLAGVEDSIKASVSLLEAKLEAIQALTKQRLDSSGEAVAKSELSVGKQLDQLGQVLSATLKAQDERITDNKSRLQAIENRSLGMATGQSDQARSVTLWVSVLSLILAVLIAVASMIVVVLSRSAPNGLVG